MSDAIQIQLAADLIHAELNGKGSLCSRDMALSIARKLHALWMKPGGPQRFIATPGEVAQKHRARYEADVRCTDIFNASRAGS